MRIVNKLATAALITTAFTLAGNAQNTKTKPKPLATPPPAGAEVVSRAGEYPDQSVLVVKEPEKIAEQPTVTDAELIKELTERIKKLEASQKN
ncbi:MAG: hypothetical protein QM785_15245 [Pyrinomonadaceae bacterium]